MPRSLISAEGFRAWTRRVRASGIATLARKTNLTRDPLAQIFIRGNGIEVGALNWPLRVPKGSQTTLVDAYGPEELHTMFPELGEERFRVDLVTPIESLEGIASQSQDYAIANHVIEHSEDPIRAFESLLRVLKVGGILFFALPDRRFTFDIKRPVSGWNHILRDYREGPEGSRRDHYREFAELVFDTPAQELEDRTEELMARKADIHFHVWTIMEMMEMVARMKTELGFPIEVEAVSRTGNEGIFVLRKTAGGSAD